MVDEVELRTDKLTEEYTLRIPERTKRLLDGLTKSQRKAVNERIMITMAECLHQFSFDATRYLMDDYDTRNGESR